MVVTGSRVATLRNLGDQRALVGSTTVDLNTIPMEFIDHVEIVAGPLADGRGLVMLNVSHDKDQGLRLPTQPLKHDNSLMRVRAGAGGRLRHAAGRHSLNPA